MSRGVDRATSGSAPARRAAGGPRRAEPARAPPRSAGGRARAPPTRRGRGAPHPTPARRRRRRERSAEARGRRQTDRARATVPFASSYPPAACSQIAFVHIDLENRVESLGECCASPRPALTLPRTSSPRGLLRTSLVVAIAVVLAACSSQPAHPVAIGLAGPFSQPRGASMLRAAQLAVNQINAKRGIRGRKLELRVVDDSGNEDAAVRVAEQLYADPVIVAVVGHLSSGPSLSAARVYGGGATPTPMISPSASSPDLSGMSPYVFRVCPSDLQHGPELARFAWHTLGARRAGIIYLNNDYGRGVRRTFTAEFARLGGSVVESDPYIPATASPEPYLSRMRRRRPDVLLPAAERPGAELALREMRSLGLRWPVLGGDALTGI